MTNPGLQLDAQCPHPQCQPGPDGHGKVNSIHFDKEYWVCTWPSGARMMHLFSELETKRVDTDRYPHKCPLCGAPAYVGAVPAAVDCSERCWR